MENDIYWLWLQGALGAAHRVDALINFFGNAKAVYEATVKDINDAHIKGVTAAKATKIKEEDIEKYYDTLDFCKSHKIELVTPESEYYPERLLEIQNFPLVLYVRGDCACLNSKKALGVIGSRTPSLYGEEATTEIVRGLCDNGYLIVSGGALGIDSIAHRSTIENGGKTVLVMGCGHGSGYLPENSQLRKDVASHGALITEYPPYSNVTFDSFPKRNRIISGMSSGVIIIEAARVSGTFSTARHAAKQSRELFVLPGDIKSGNFEGSNQLIIEGAKPVFSAEDILSVSSKKKDDTLKTGNPFEGILTEASSYKKRKSGKKNTVERAEEKKNSDREDKKTAREEKNTEKNIKINMETISKNAGIVYNIMSDGTYDFDGIALESGLPARKVLTALTELEMEGIITKSGSNEYRFNQ